MPTQTALDEFILAYKKTPNAAVYLIVLDNLPMLILAYGYKGAHEQVENLVTELHKSGQAFRIESDQIAIIIPSPKAEMLIEKDAEIRKTIRAFGKDKKCHIAALTSYATGIGVAPEKMLEKVYAAALRSLQEDMGNNHQEESILEMKAASDVEAALRDNKFRLACQPIVDSKSGVVSHSECLLRIENEDGKLVSAGSLIPIAERMGLIDDVDVHVLEMVIEKLKNDKDIKLAFNISNLTIANQNWIKRFFKSITPKLAERMVIEITETAAARNLRETAYFIATVQEAGCQVAIDDFGAGYTSFRQIKALSVDIIKLDGSMIQDITSNLHNRQLVASLVGYLKGIGIKTIAEHVDSGEKAKLLMEMGVDYMQGNYFGAAA